MTIALAWVATRTDQRQDLYLATDSRTRGARVLDLSPKILLLPRTDCAICFAGDTAAAYPLMLHISAAISAHEPARERNLDVGELVMHLLRILTDTLGRVKDFVQPFDPTDAQFIFGGYSWKAKGFQIWTIYFEQSSKSFRARPCKSFHARLSQIAFIGDMAQRFRSEFIRSLNDSARKVNLEPLRQLAQWLRKAGKDDTIGGAPQIVRIGPHMNSRPLCVLWGEEKRRHLYGRELLEYEHCDFWAIDPDTGRSERPRHFKVAERKDAE